MGLVNTLHTILTHPLNSSTKRVAFERFVRWQISSRLAMGPTIVPFVNGTHLILTNGMSGATGNVYTGLFEFADCAFLLHLLRSTDLFIDVGSNVGVYTVLASGAVGASTISIEPIPSTYKALEDNIRMNNMSDRVASYNIGLGRRDDILRFTEGLGPCNHVVTGNHHHSGTIEVPVRSLDEVLDHGAPTLIKIDVEGWESEILAGAETTLKQPSLLALIVEMDSRNKSLNSNEQSVHDCLTRHGFAPHSYEPFKRKLLPLSSKNLDHSNTIYLRNTDVVINRIETAKSFRVNDREI